MTTNSKQPKKNLSDPSLNTKGSLTEEDTVLKAVTSTKQKVVKNSVFTLAVILILLFGAIQPTVITITKILTEINEKEELLDDLKTKTNNISNLKKEFNGTGAETNTVRNQIENLSLIYPSRGDFSLVMLNINEIVEKNEFEMQSINFDTPSKNTNTETDEKELDILEPWATTLSVKGSRANLITLLEDLESIPMYPEVTNISFSNQEDDKGQMTFSIQMEIYKINDPDFYLIN